MASRNCWIDERASSFLEISFSTSVSFFRFVETFGKGIVPFDKVFEYIDDHAESEQKILFDGQIYDAFKLLISLVQKATKKIVLIDGYVDTGTLNILAKKNAGVNVTIYTFSNTRLSQGDITTFSAQYPNLTVKHMTAFHDRFPILDDTVGYHVGASLKDAGKKCFGITQIQDEQTIQDILNRL